jgi:hypothetical protein
MERRDWVTLQSLRPLETNMKTSPLILILVLLVVGCGQLHIDEEALEETVFGKPLPNQVELHDHDAHSHDHEHEGETTAADMQVVLVPSELVVGQNRMAVGLLDGKKQMIQEADVHFQYFDLSDPATPQSEQEAAATVVQSPDGRTTIFAHDRRFEHAGEWGLEVQANLVDGQTAVQRIKFNVTPNSNSVLPGDVAPQVQTPKLIDAAGDFSQITSAWEPNPAFYQLSLDEALTNGKPTVLLLATPAFCQTRFCGPAYEIATTLETEFGDTVNFIHVEVYAGLPDPSQTDWTLSPVMDAFGLRTEPWVYVMDADGQVVYRAEGMFTEEEIATYLPQSR